MEKILTNDMVQEWIKNNPGENTYKVEGGVTVIDSNALRKRAFQIEHLILPDSVEVVSSYAFNNSLKSISLSKNLKKIFGYAFFGCRNIESIELPDGLKEIGKSAFAGCEKLKDISIPESCKKIDNGAFCDCPLLNEIKHPCISIDKKAYINYCNSELEKYFDKEAESVVIPDGIKKIGYEAFMDCTKLKKILIPDSVTEIEEGAFSGCSSLEEIRIPTQVLKIGGYAFSRCSSLKEIIIPESVQSIGDFAFGECSNLTSVSIPDHLISQWEYFKRTDSEVLSLCNIGGPGPGDHTFKGCTSLTEETKEMLRKHSFDV
ncbi:MAG: leucine-rich repeat domain-containing protein [Spirochaetales bacterium]|nr:leucine-rich repeat domain-containing protein [Spirochaetales bacterium]